MTSSNPRSRWYRSVVAWVALTALVPSFALLHALFVDVRARQTEARNTAPLAQGVRELGALITLWIDLSREHAASDLTVRARTVGADPAAMSDRLGFDTTAQIASIRLAVEQSFGLLRTIDTVRAVEEAHRALQSRLDAGEVTIESIEGEWHRVANPVIIAVEARFDALYDTTAALDLPGRWHETLRNLDAVWTVVRAATSETRTVLSMVGNLPEIRTVLRDDLMRHQGALRAAVPKLRQLTGAPAQAWNDLQNDPAVLAFERSIPRLIEETVSGFAAIPIVLSALPGSIARARQYEALLRSAVAQSLETTAREQQSAGDRATRAIVYALALSSVSMAVVVVFSLRIVRPMRSLAQHVARLGAGAIDDPPEPRGPRELALVTQSIADVVSTIRTVEVQAKAIASLALDDPSLRAQLPGRLGASVNAATQQLVRSVEDRLQLERRLAHDATHDSLTGLLNRAGMRTHLEQHIVGPDDRHIGLLFVDLDGFKTINDVHGHAIGDEVLRCVASRIVEAAGAHGQVGRFGGDEFLVSYIDAPGTRDLEALGERILRALREPIRIGGKLHLISASVGVSRLPPRAHQAGDVDLLIRNADHAMLQAKGQGKGRVELFDEDSMVKLNSISEIEIALAQAIDDGELTMHYQPIVHSATGELRSLESLVRWQRGNGLVFPDAFIPIAERSDLILSLGRAVLDQVCAQLAAWTRDPRLGRASVSVNLSGKHMLAGIAADDVLYAIDKAGIDPARLCVEITETVLLSDLKSVAAQLRALRSKGVRIAIDDFGTGFTSFGHLRHLPIDMLKIDRSYIQGIHRAVDSSIAQLLINTAHVLELEVVAEGVEHVGQQQRLVQLGCDCLQGFLVSKPVPVDVLEAWCEANAAPAPAR